jgi:hypothetical protein
LPDKYYKALLKKLTLVTSLEVPCMQKFKPVPARQGTGFSVFI